MFYLLISLLCLASSYLYLYMACFKEQHKEETYRLMEISSIVFECTFGVYSLLQFFKAYQPNNRANVEERDLYKIAINYLTTEFL